MNEINNKCLEVFPAWLASLGEDVNGLLELLEKEDLDISAKKFLIGGLNYSFTSLDLVPDVVADIGYLDDAFVLRLAATAAIESGAADEGVLKGLAVGTNLVKEFLGDDISGRLDKYVRGLSKAAARGRTTDELTENADVFKDFAKDVRDFAGEYKAPDFSKDEKSLIKLKAFLEAKLP